MCNVCTFNVNGSGCNACGSTWNRCGCNTCTQSGLFSTLFGNSCGCNACGSTWNRRCNCVTICGNLGSVFGTNGASTTNGDAYYARQYGLTRNGCNSCCNAYDTAYGND